MMKWEHFHIAIPSTDPPPNHSKTMIWRLNRELGLTMQRDTVINHLGQTDAAELHTDEPDAVSMWPALSVVAVIAFLFGWIIAG